MRLLLDTHIALWAIVGDMRLSSKALALIEDPDNEIVVSAATLWEIAIKRSLARGRPNDMPIDAVAAFGFFQRAGYRLLGIAPEHAVAVESLPKLHSDPFDRILVAQALVEPMRLLTHDSAVVRYSSSFIEI